MRKTIVFILIIVSLVQRQFIFAQVSLNYPAGNNYFEITRIMDEYLNTGKDSINKEDYEEFSKQYFRWKSYMQPRIGYEGSLDSLSKSLNAYFSRSVQQKKSLLSAASVGTLNFDNYLGPVGIPPDPTNSTRGSTGKGWVEDIFVEPNDPDIIYAGTHHSGLWKTTNGGDSWEDLTFNYPLIDGVINFVFDPNDSLVIYLLTGNRYPGGLGKYSNGLYKSTNGGQTWGKVDINPGSGNYYPSVHDTIQPRKILTHPTNSNILYLLTTTKILRTIDGGSTWTIQRETLTYLPDGKYKFDEIYEDAEFDPSDPSIVYFSGNVILKSTHNASFFNDITYSVCNQWHLYCKNCSR